MNQYQQYIFKSRYARYLPEKKRRETWEECVQRYIDFWKPRISEELHEELDRAKQYILDMKVMPSMRALFAAGPALEEENMLGFNCSYIAMDHEAKFQEILYILMCGTGVGFSVERQYINRLSKVPEKIEEDGTTIVVEDSRIGWATAFGEYIRYLYCGRKVNVDVSKVRPKGAPLKTTGGRASGPEPLVDLLDFTYRMFMNARGRKLQSIEVHDIVCKIGAVVVVGGVRRSALLSLSNLSDERMRMAKSGQWWTDNGQRALANNSVCYTEKPDMHAFMKEWTALMDSGSGERGIFNRVACSNSIPERRKALGYTEWGTNPCSEIILRDRQLCNLTEVVLRHDDSSSELYDKVGVAAFLGTLQSTLTKFNGFLSPLWKWNTEGERLLGVSLTGLMDTETFEGLYHQPLKLEAMREVAIATNRRVAEVLGIRHSTAVTCVKPSGTVSQLVDASSGLHARFAPYFIRRVRGDYKDPLTRFMIEKGIPNEPDVTAPDDVCVFSFPMRAPKNTIVKDDVTAKAQLRIWKTLSLHYCEHKPSCTVYVKPHEWLEVGAWVYENFDICSGISFLPSSDHVYKQAPYEEITEVQYNELAAKMPSIDFDTFIEEYDSTQPVRELACTAGVCEL